MQDATAQGPLSKTFWRAFRWCAHSPSAVTRDDVHEGGLAAFAYGLVVVLLTHHLAERMRSSPLVSRVLTKVAGVCLLAFGVKLAISK